MAFDVDEFEERAAICEFDGGMSRFAAETAAARSQGVERWQAVNHCKEASNAIGRRASGGHGHSAQPMDGQRDADHLPGVQRASEKEERPMSERDAQAGRDCGELLALRMGSGAAL